MGLPRRSGSSQYRLPGPQGRSPEVDPRSDWIPPPAATIGELACCNRDPGQPHKRRLEGEGENEASTSTLTKSKREGDGTGVSRGSLGLAHPPGRSEEERSPGADSPGEALACGAGSGATGVSSPARWEPAIGRLWPTALPRSLPSKTTENVRAPAPSKRKDRNKETAAWPQRATSSFRSYAPRFKEAVPLQNKDGIVFKQLKYFLFYF